MAEELPFDGLENENFEAANDINTGEIDASLQPSQEQPLQLYAHEFIETFSKINTTTSSERLRRNQDFLAGNLRDEPTSFYWVYDRCGNKNVSHHRQRFQKHQCIIRVPEVPESARTVASRVNTCQETFEIHAKMMAHAVAHLLPPRGCRAPGCSSTVIYSLKSGWYNHEAIHKSKVFICYEDQCLLPPFKDERSLQDHMDTVRKYVPVVCPVEALC